jgi:hypothetical protein
MAPSHVPPDALFQVGEGLPRRRLREQGAMHIVRRVSTDAADDHLVPFSVPLENGAGTEAQLAPHRRRHGHLPLRGQF